MPSRTGGMPSRYSAWACGPHRRAAPTLAPRHAYPYTALTTTAQAGGPQRAAPMLVLRLIVLLLLALTVAASTLSRHVLIVWRDSNGHNAIAGHSAAVSIIPAAGAVEVDYDVHAARPTEDADATSDISPCTVCCTGSRAVPSWDGCWQGCVPIRSVLAQP